LQKAFTFEECKGFGVISLDVKLLVDGKEISLNEFVSKILSGTFVGAIGSLREIDGNWKRIKIEITK
jgi:hypothetical protein